MNATLVVIYIHVLAAFAYVAGYVATNVLTELARRSTDLADRRRLLALSGTFDRRLLIPGAVATGIAGLGAAWLAGYPLASLWLSASIVIFLAITVLGMFYWGPVGGRVEHAMTEGDMAAADAVLKSPRNLVLARAENLGVLVVITLMVFRPA